MELRERLFNSARAGEDLVFGKLVIEGLVVSDIFSEMGVLGDELLVLVVGGWRSKGRAASSIKMPFQPGLPDIEDARLPFGRDASGFETNALAVLFENGFGVFLEFISINDGRNLASDTTDGIEEAELGIIADLTDGDVGVHLKVRCDAFDGIADDKGVLALANELFVLEDVLLAMEGHVLDKDVLLARLRNGGQDLLLDAFVSNGVVGINVEVGNFGTLLANVEEVAKRLMDDSQISTFNHGAFKNSAQRARVNPQNDDLLGSSHYDC